MSLSLTQAAANMITTAGYGGLTLGLILDSAGIPIPSEVLIPLAVVSARQGHLSLPLVIIIGTLAQTVGGAIAYEIGRRGGIPLIERYGRYVLISRRDLALTHRQFQRYGRPLALVGRCVPFIRGYVGFVAGIAAMPRRDFIGATVIGSLLWTLILAAAGYALARDITVIDRVIAPVSAVVIAVIALAIAWFVWRRFKHNRKNHQENHTQA